jgi:UDP-N-acetylmuramoyl-tripeptide--D-alanyl-D-alanine ligase
MRITASEVALATDGTLIGVDAEAFGISFDSRNLSAGQAFVAIVDTRDGHEFLADAAQKGAAFAVVNKMMAHGSLPCVEVDDTVVALAAVGHMCRERINESVEKRVVGITGSVGKTSTKDLVMAVLSSQFTGVHGPNKSLNNDIGVPVTIVNAPDDCNALVLEMGMRGLGEIARLCSIARPEIGIITEVGDAHSERVGGIDGVVQAKSELLNSLPSSGVAIVNADSLNAMRTTKNTTAKVLTFGTHESADIRFEINSVASDGTSTATFYYQGDSCEGYVPLPGAHMVSNAAAAVAVGVTVGMPLSLCVMALKNVLPSPHRMAWVVDVSGIRILDDSYNANVTSMSAALRTLAEVPAQKRIAVLGAMAEVAGADSSHAQIASLCLELGIELISLETDLYRTAAMSVDEVVRYLKSQPADTVVLAKGSRVAAVERVVQAFSE